MFMFIKRLICLLLVGLYESVAYGQRCSQASLPPKIKTSVTTLVLLAVLTACGTSNPLRGKWIHVKSEGDTSFGGFACFLMSPVEFLDNGKVIVGGASSGKYQFLDDSRIEIDFGQGKSVMEYKISDGNSRSRAQTHWQGYLVTLQSLISDSTSQSDELRQANPPWNWHASLILRNNEECSNEENLH